MRDKGIDYFENSRRATYAQQQYAIRNPEEFGGYGEICWGLTASDGPGADGAAGSTACERTFFDYVARGAPYGPDDGTIAPWAVVASLPFAPEIVLPTIEHFDRLQLQLDNPYGFKATFNPTYSLQTAGKNGWVSPYHFGINQGPIVADDRELPDRPAVEPDARLPLSGQRAAPGRVHGRLAGSRGRRRSARGSARGAELA